MPNYVYADRYKKIRVVDTSVPVRPSTPIDSSTFNSAIADYTSKTSPVKPTNSFSSVVRSSASSLANSGILAKVSGVGLVYSAYDQTKKVYEAAVDMTDTSKGVGKIVSGLSNYFSDGSVLA